ncbi:fructan 6-exohydrolase-like isoform X3 [Silene latifolia]|uniref:fructan 6-exohydrolase-like isoform X3 n=1 Tax=Silene latifolia TaxID=37657 RepID=UPI003D774878
MRKFNLFIGPMVYKGVYHLFYQHYPKPYWNTKIIWGHSTSTDLVNWIPQPTALTPSTPYDINGCWSGSATILPGDKPAILYTGINTDFYQVQNMAFPKDPSDPYLKEWVKVVQNPVMVGTPGSIINASEFRDPTTAWILPDGKWRAIVGTKDNKRGLAVLFTSEDFMTWTEAKHPFHSAEGTGVWECPDFYPVYVEKSVGADASVTGSDVKHALKVSLFDTEYEYYTIGTYDTEKDIYRPDEGSIESDLGLRYDYGKFYASKSFFDSNTDRRITWGWVNESSTAADDKKKGWSGVQAIPRTIVLDKSGKQLVLWPIKEMETLRENQVHFPPQLLGSESKVKVPQVLATQADVEVSFKVTEYKKAEELDPTWTNPQILCSQKGANVKGGLGPFGLLTLASDDLEEYTAVFFRIFKATDKYVVLMCSDQSRSSLNPTTDKLSFGTFVDVDPVKDEISLRILIDHSIVESFGAEGKSCITARVYPTLAIGDKANLYAFNYGTEDVKITKLNAWSMKKARINPTGDNGTEFNNRLEHEQDF